MARIQIKSLDSAGLDLFSGAESFISEFSDADHDASSLRGGCSPALVGAITGVLTAGIIRRL